MEYNNGMPSILLPLAYSLLNPAAHAAPARMLPAAGGWFYADAADDSRMQVDAQGFLAGVPVYRTGVVLVGLETLDAASVVAAHKGVQSVHAIDHDGLLLAVDLGATADDFAVSRTLRALPGVEFAHPDLARELQPHALPDDPYVDEQWHLENLGQSGGAVDADIDADLAWTIATGAGVMVSVVDTGVEPLHPDLRVTCGYNYVEDTEDCHPADNNAHGTAAAGVIGAIGNNGIGVAGVAYDADIFGVRLLGGSTSDSDMYDAFRSSVDAGAAVINNSWGYGTGCAAYALTGTMRRAFLYTEENGRDGLGTVVVFSAGNSDCDMSPDGIAAWPTTVSVAALDRFDRKESYSNYGRGMDVGGSSGGLLTTDITGDPGYGNFEGDPDYAPHFSGTSAAAPVVSGVLALMFEANPDLTAEDARTMLRATSDKVHPEHAEYDDSGWSPVYGYGRVNAAAAVMAVANERPDAPQAIGPAGDPYEDRVILQWGAPIDPDGDALTYTVQWTAWPPATDDSGDTGEDAPESVTTEVTGLTTTTLDLTGSVSANTRVEWSVIAHDAWTTTTATDAPEFTVQPIPDPPEPEPEPEPQVETDPGPDPLGPPTETDTVSADGGTDKGGGCAVASTGVSWGWLVGLGLLARRRSRSAGDGFGTTPS